MEAKTSPENKDRNVQPPHRNVVQERGAEHSEMPAREPEQLILTTLELERVAFDEMNLVEHPVGLLSNTTKGYIEVPLSPDGETKLVCPRNPHGFPNHLAEPTLLGLMWLTMVQNNFQSPKVKFKLCDFVKNFVFPERYFGKKKVSHCTMNAIENQINAIAYTRIESTRWYRKNEGKSGEANVAIIDAVHTNGGGRGNSQEVELVWGVEFYESIRAKYTKSLNPAVYMRLRKPLDRRFFRWLDRQLQCKDRQHVHSCCDFVRYKLLVTNAKVQKPGKRASNIIVKMLAESINRMQDLGFGVKMAVDTSNPDFSLTFIKLEKGRKEVVLGNEVFELVNTFHVLAFGIPFSEQPGKRTIPTPDKNLAEVWLEQYGLDQAKWMVKRCIEIQRSRGAEPILLFRGLSLYEHAAAGEYKKAMDAADSKKKADVRNREEAGAEAQWRGYCDLKKTEAETKLSDEQKKALLLEAQRLVSQETPSLAGNDRLVQHRYDVLLLRAVGAKAKEEFLADRA